MKLSAHDLQVHLEDKYNESKLGRDILAWIRKHHGPALDEAELILDTWIHTPANWASKQTRKDQAADLDTQAVVERMAVIATMQGSCGRKITIQAFASQIAGMFPDWGNKKLDDIRTAAEMLAEVGNKADIFYIHYGDGEVPYMTSCMEIPDVLQDRVWLTGHPLPMVVEPLPLKDSHTTGYLTIPGHLVLGSPLNRHSREICLDVLNLQNNTPMALDILYLRQIDDAKPTGLDAEQKTQWEHQNLQTKLIAIEMIKAGNQFWFTHRVDTRGRMYARGYQLNPQGNSWRKAMLILADPDYVEITR